MPAALTPAEKHHPAKFSGSVLETLKDLLGTWTDAADEIRVLDPYAGVGWIHRLATCQRTTIAVELERPWARNHGHAGRTVQATARRLPLPDSSIHVIATSAVYMNRMRDHHTARDASKRMTYTHQMRNLTGNPNARLHPENMGAMTDAEYRVAAQNHVAEFKRVTVGGGLLMLNMSNSISLDVETNTVEQWINWLTLARCWIREVRPVDTPRLRFGANHQARAEHEVIIVAEFPPKAAQQMIL